MVGVQNQAAVDAACALRILGDLAATAKLPSTSVDQPEAKHIVFSVATEGPIHEMWVHYRLDGAYHMTLLQIWRTTIAKHAREFVHALRKVLEWGVHAFRTAILKDLVAVETQLREERMEE